MCNVPKFENLKWDGNLENLDFYVDVKIMPKAFSYPTAQSTKDMEAKMSPEIVRRMKKMVARKVAAENKSQWYINWYIHEILNLDDEPIDAITEDTDYEIITAKDRSREDRLRNRAQDKLRRSREMRRKSVEKSKTAKKEKRELRRSR